MCVLSRTPDLHRRKLFVCAAGCSHHVRELIGSLWRTPQQTRVLSLIMFLIVLSVASGVCDRYNRGSSKFYVYLGLTCPSAERPCVNYYPG